MFLRGLKRSTKPCKTSKAKVEPADKDGDLSSINVNNMKYYCKGRGCRHRGMPDFQPTAVSFYMKGSECSHLEVKKRIDDLLPLSPGAKIESVQFVPLPVHLDSVHSDNRWIIKLNTVEARNRLSGRTCHIKGRKVTLRRYDDIIHLEYRKCSRATHLLHMVNKIKNFDNGIQDIISVDTFGSHKPDSVVAFQ